MSDNYNETILMQLSSALQATLTAFETSNILETQNTILSSFAQNLSAFSPQAIQDAITAATSGIPIHPYDRLKYEYLGPDYIPKTLEDVEDPGELPVMECVNYIKQKGQEVQSTLFHNLTCAKELQLDTVYSYVSGDEVVYNISKQRSILEFFEFAKTIKPSDITDENCNEIARKLMCEYIKAI
jgi:hypothetical protein